jgi:putative inorganic carbon (HCO3(-)) transporter
VVLSLLPLTLLPVIDWSIATAKLYGMLLGIALVYALANAISSLKRALFGVYGTAIFVGGGLAAASLVGTEWPPPSKLAPFGFVYQRLPLLIQHLVPTTAHGAVHANEIGGAITMFIPLATATALTNFGWQQSIARKALFLGLVFAGLLTMLVLLLTQSRSAYLGCGLGLMVVLGWWLVAEQKSMRRRQAGSAVTTLLIVTACFVVWRGAVNWMSLQQANADSLPSRLEVWERSLEMVRDFPFTGIGMGQFSMVLHGLYVPFLLRSTYVPHAHNFFLQLGLDLGIPGAIAMLCVLGCFFVAMLRIARSAEERELRGAAVGLAAGMVAFLTYGLTDAIAIGARGAIGVWIVLGLGAALYRVTADNWTSMLNQSQRS